MTKANFNIKRDTGGNPDPSVTRIIIRLPDNLTVSGNLILVDSGITELPEHLTVRGDLDLRGTEVTKLRPHLKVGGSLNLNGIPITELPDHLTVGRNLDLRGTRILKLPANLTVGRDLLLDGIPAELPDDLHVRGTVYRFDPPSRSARRCKRPDAVPARRAQPA